MNHELQPQETSLCVMFVLFLCRDARKEASLDGLRTFPSHFIITTQFEDVFTMALLVPSEETSQTRSGTPGYLHNVNLHKHNKHMWVQP